MADQFEFIQSDGWSEGFDISNVLQSQTRSINQSVSNLNNQPLNPIKSTVSDIQSGIALIKETDRQFLNQLHAYRSETIDTINDYLSNLTGGKINLNDFGKVISIKDGFKIDKNQLNNMASKALGFNIETITNVDKVKNDLADEFLSELNEMSLGLSNGLFQNDNGKITISGDYDRQVGDAVFGFLTNSQDDFRTVRNFAASNAVLNTMVSHNASIGFVEGFGAFKGLYLYESDYHNALIKSIDVLLRRGDVNSLDEVMKILDKEGATRVRAVYPRFAESVMSNFSLPKTALVEEYSVYGEKLVTLIEGVLGERWDLCQSFYGETLNIGLVSRLSPDSQTVMEHFSQTLIDRGNALLGKNKVEGNKLIDKAERLIMITNCAGFIAEENPSDVFRTDFPDAVTF